jgi:hypothetical protein
VHVLDLIAHDSHCVGVSRRQRSGAAAAGKVVGQLVEAQRDAVERRAELVTQEAHQALALVRRTPNGSQRVAELVPGVPQLLGHGARLEVAERVEGPSRRAEKQQRCCGRERVRAHGVPGAQDAIRDAHYRVREEGCSDGGVAADEAKQDERHQPEEERLDAGHIEQLRKSSEMSAADE